MRRRRFIKLGSQFICSNLFLIGSSPARIATSPVPNKSSAPNVLLLLADDLRSDALGFMGNSIVQTPHLNQLAAKSTVFENCFVTTSICPTSRVSILTGRYASNHGIWDFNTSIHESLWKKSLPYMFRARGYRTGFVGKWGLGGDVPSSKYDFFEGFSGQGEYIQSGQHMQDRLLRSSLNFLNTCNEKPFFLQMSFKTPHVQDGAAEPFQAPESYSQLYQDWNPQRKTTDHFSYFKQLPQSLQSGEGFKRYQKRYETDEQYRHNMRQYYRLITGMDHAIGKLIQVLKEKKFLDNTIIIFTSDNGLLTGEYGLAGKWWMFEGSIRVPLMIYIPGKTAVRDQRMVLNIDLAPTLTDLCELHHHNMQGLQLFDASRYYEREAFYYEHRFQTKELKILPSTGLRTKNHKYFKFSGPDNAEFLFNITLDQDEKFNLISLPQYRYILMEMRQLHDKLAINVANDFD